MMRKLELYRLPAVKPSKNASQFRRRAFESLMVMTCAFLCGTYATLYIIVTLKSIKNVGKASGEMFNQSRMAFGKITGKTIDDTSSVLEFKNGLNAVSQAYKEIYRKDEEVVHVILTR